MIQKREDIAGKIHKAIRKSLFETGLAAGRTDFSVQAEVEELRPRLADMLAILRMHGHKEDDFVLPMLLDRAPEIVAHDTEAHHVIEKLIDGVEASYGEVAADGITPQERDRRGTEFFNTLNHFIGEYMLHMHGEETETAARMYENFSDEELAQLSQRIVGALSPQEMMMTMKYMVPAINTPERDGLLGAIKAAAPAPVYEQIAAFADAPLMA